MEVLDAYWIVTHDNKRIGIVKVMGPVYDVHFYIGEGIGDDLDQATQYIIDHGAIFEPSLLRSFFNTEG